MEIILGIIAALVIVALIYKSKSQEKPSGSATSGKQSDDKGLDKK